METKQINNLLLEQAETLSNLSSEIMKKATVFMKTLDKQEWTIDKFIEAITLANSLSNQAYQNYYIIKEIKGY